MVIVFSGFRDDTLKSQIENAGGKVAGSLVKTATHLLVKKDGKHSKKNDEAKEKGITILDLAEFVSVHNFHLAEKKPREKKEKIESSEDEATPVAIPSDAQILLNQAMNDIANAQITLTAAVKVLADLQKMIL
jgi:hypothetical protein